MDEKGNGHFGKWIIDEYGLPAYEYTCDQYTDPLAKTPTTYGASIDHFHQIGNDRITATAHNGGYIQVLESSRGFQWLTFKDDKKPKLGGGIGILQIEPNPFGYSDLYTSEVSQLPIKYTRVFGTGYFKKTIESEDLKYDHIICAPFSDDPVFISEMEFINTSKEEKTINILDLWDINIRHLTKSLIVTSNNRKLYGKTKLLNGAGKVAKLFLKIFKKDTDGSREKFDKKFTFNTKIDKKTGAIVIEPIYKKKSPVDYWDSAKHNFFPNPIFLSLVHEEAKYGLVEQNKIIESGNLKIDFNKYAFNKESIKKEGLKNPALGIGTRIIIKPNETRRLTFILGYTLKEFMGDFITKYRAITESESILKWNSNKWNASFIELSLEGKPWLSRESKWHSYYTRSAGYYDEYYEQHKFPQGSIYQFGHGFDGAIRDYVLFLQTIIFIKPVLAKEYLISIIKLMTPEGKLPYGLHGFGLTLSASVHSNPSDLYLFYIWGILQYVYFTRDFGFLEEHVDFYPRSQEGSSTVLYRIYKAIDYLFSNKVGFGDHGLVKSNDGDWSDGISLLVRNRKKFIKNGESNFNSTFFIFILQKLIPYIESFHPIQASEYTEKLNTLKENTLKSFNGKWFYRGWDGQNNPIGDNNIYLEHHTWLLIAKILNEREAGDLIQYIYKQLDEPSAIGQHISYPPQKTLFNILPKGWDVNGGIWHAMNALLTWGYSDYDPKKALNSLIKNSMAKRAEVYPNLWYGIWSGPDAYIAEYAENPGEAFYHLATPMCDFPLMNLNIHACYLLSVIKMAGFEADFNSITINLNRLNQNYSFKSPFISIELNSKQVSIDFNYNFKNSFLLKVLKHDNWAIDQMIILNKKDITDNEITFHKKKSILIRIEKT